MSRQLSIFGVEARPASPLDLEGLLAGPGQVARMGGTARISIVVDAAWRARVLLAETTARGIVATCERIKEPAHDPGPGTTADPSGPEEADAPVEPRSATAAGHQDAAGRGVAGGRGSAAGRRSGTATGQSPTDQAGTASGHPPTDRRTASGRPAGKASTPAGKTSGPTGDAATPTDGVMPADAGTPTGKASTPTDAGTPTGKAPTPTGKASTPTDAGTPTGKAPTPAGKASTPAAGTPRAAGSLTTPAGRDSASARAITVPVGPSSSTAAGAAPGAPAGDAGGGPAEPPTAEPVQQASDAPAGKPSRPVEPPAATAPVADRILFRTAYTAALAPLGRAWLRGTGKYPPSGFALDGRRLRLWVAAAGERDGGYGYLLRLGLPDEAAWDEVGRALAAVGLPATLIGVDAGGPAYRIIGRRRLARLAELVGDAPAQAPDGSWPG